MNFHLPTIFIGVHQKAGDWKKLAARLGAVWSTVGLDDVIISKITVMAIY